MQKFKKLNGKAAYIPINNIDTDMIIPKQYLKTIKRSGLGKYLFADLRYDIDGNLIEDFVLNKQPGTTVLVAGENFGCGSSREHAPWALLDFGIKAIIAPSFADIFYNNCFKNGILPIKVSYKEIALLASYSSLVIDLEKQTITYANNQFFFSIEEHRKQILLEGLDDIEKVLKLSQEIKNFEQQYCEKYPWLNEGDNLNRGCNV